MRVNVAYSCNESYIQHTGISMISLFENNKDLEDLNVYFIYKDVSNKSLSILQDIATQYSRKLYAIPFITLCHDLVLSDTGRHIETIYSKLFFTRIEGIDKIFYLDSDTVVVGSIKELWNVDLDEYYFGGVETFTVDAKSELGLLPTDNFINDGVVLLNLKDLRRDKVLDDLLEGIAKFHGNPPLLSEGLINKVCKGKILSLHPKYNLLSGLVFFKKNRFIQSPYLKNYYSDSEISEAISNPVVIHYLGALYNRPWDINCSHPFKGEYLHFKDISPWRDVPLNNVKLPLRLRLISFLFQVLPFSFFKVFRRISKYGVQYKSK